ncbi:DUF5071 domain-containing protein [Flavobacteriaceae bacterium 3-367]|uniref:DUF5071 domain-containing protein n=1 Tax=Eudoraea algarum TaxID=3417568 RepID=UPI003292CF8C
MNIEKLIPTDKGDVETAKKLKNYSYEELRPIIPLLLEWIQDMNWPVAGPVADYLASISEHLTDNIIGILKGRDDVWKYWCVKVFGIDAIKPIDPKLWKEFNRIATNPSPQEIAEEVHELAVELMNNS